MEELSEVLKHGDANATELFPSNDQWQYWRGKRHAYSWVIGKKQRDLELKTLVDANDPRVVFDDEEDPDGDTNPLED